jgi:hypothetical protein
MLAFDLGQLETAVETAVIRELVVRVFAWITSRLAPVPDGGDFKKRSWHGSSGV